MRPILQNLVVLFVSAIVVGFSTQAYALDCSNVEDVVKEAIEFSMLGARAQGMTNACYANETYKYFAPEDGEDETDERTPITVIWFDRARDHYTYVTKREGDFVQIQAVFTVKGKKFRTKFTYQPMEYLQKEAGICGIVYNDEHEILRSDCRAKP